MVVSVSFSGVSVSYSGIDGAGRREERVWSSAPGPDPAHHLPSMLSLRMLRTPGRGTFGKGSARVTRPPSLSAKEVLTSDLPEGSFKVQKSLGKGGSGVANSPHESKVPHQIHR